MGKGLTLEQAKELIKIDKHSLDEVCMQHSVLYDDIADQHTEVKSERDEIKLKLKELVATLGEEKRRQLEDEGVPINKITDKKVMELVDRDSRQLALARVLNKLITEVDYWNNRKESFIQRSPMIKDLCGLFKTNYYQRESIKTDDVEESIQTTRRKRFRD